MPRYNFTLAQRGWIETSDDPLAKNLRALIGMYNAQADHACLGQLDAAVKELGVRWPEIMKELNVRRKTEHQQRVEELMAGAKQHVPDRPTVPDIKTLKLRARLILEEAVETIHAMGLGILVGKEKTWLFKDVEFSKMPDQDPILEDIADGCADVIVVTTGTLSACGIADDSLQHEVDINNLKKFKHRCPGCHRVLRPKSMPVSEETGDKPGERRCLCCGEVWMSGYRREDGKWVKPSTHKPPDIGGVLKKQTAVAEAEEVERTF